MVRNAIVGWYKHHAELNLLIYRRIDIVRC